MKRRTWAIVVYCAGLGLLCAAAYAQDGTPSSQAQKNVQPIADKRPAVGLLAEFVSMTEKAITVKRNDEVRTFTITPDTKFMGDDDKQVKRDTLSLKKGDDVVVITEIGGSAALSIKKGGMRIRF